MTLHEELTADIAEAEAHLGELRAHLTSLEPWLEQDVLAVKSYFSGALKYLEGKL